MSKILDVTPISNTAQMPIKSGTLQFLQDAHKESLTNVIKGLIGGSYSATTYYILNGCVNTGVGSNYIISSGAIFFNGEVYDVQSTTFTTTGGQVPVMNIQTTQYTSNADPVTFTDGSVQNVHDIRSIVISAGTASGNQYGVNSTNIFVNFANSTPNIIEQTNFASLKTKVLTIPGWDMTGTPTLNVAHGLADFKKIRSIDAVVINDAQTEMYPLYYGGYTGPVVDLGGSFGVNSTNVTLYSYAAGPFASGSYASMANDRGYITIQYEA